MISSSTSLLGALLAEVLAVPVVITFFRLIPDKKIAAVCAAVIFLAVGVTVLMLLLRQKAYACHLSFWAVLTHLFVVTLPLFITRMTNWQSEFSDLTIWGVPGPEFHLLAGKIYNALLAATIIDIILMWVAARRSKTTQAQKVLEK